MILVSFVFALLCVAFIIQPTPCESLQCYECSGKKSCGRRSTDPIVDCDGNCLSYLTENKNGTVIQRCCSDNCMIENALNVYSCSKNRCNGIHSDSKVLAMKNNLSPKRIIQKRTAEESNSLLSCYECSGHNPSCGIDNATVANGCRACLVFHNIYDNNNVIRQCCTSGCGEPGTVGDYNGRTAYFCGLSLCNGIGAENELTSEGDKESSTTMLSSTISTIIASTTTVVTTVPTTSQCYECSGSECGKEGSSVSSNCPSCMVYRNSDDQNKIERRCCWWACGAPNTVVMYEGRETYFCTGNKCNGYGVESALSPVVTTTSATTQKTVSKCYECSGPACGKPGSSVSANCPSCMAYRNPNDQTKIERRCCWWACGAPNTVGMYNGMETYFCTGDECNEYGVESALSPPVTTSTIAQITTATSSSIVTTATTTQQTSSQCYECSGPNCGKEGSSVSANCPSCMAYRNPNDQTKIERHCCWWACGAPNTVVTTSTIAQITTARATSSSIVTTVTTAVTVTTTQQTSSRCYECSGPDCGKEGSSVSENCRSCMVYRNPDDQTKIERHCCWWWACGAPNTVGMYNGMETYFCTGDKCNGYGAESALSPPVTTTSTSIITTSAMITTQMTTVTSSSGSCVLNCQNGGTPETADGCFCYCLDNTYGRECENVNCSEPDVDSEMCSAENQPLCEESESFAFECHDLCGKC